MSNAVVDIKGSTWDRLVASAAELARSSKVNAYHVAEHLILMESMVMILLQLLLLLLLCGS